MKKLIFISLLILNVHYYSQAQLQTGRYFRINSKSFCGFLKPKIPSYLFLDINSDSTYYVENLWGSFVENENGTWRTFNDTVVLFPKRKDEFDRTLVIGKSSRRVDSLNDKITIQVNDMANRPAKGFIIELYKDKLIHQFVTDLNGRAIFDYCRFDSLSIKGNRYTQFEIFTFTPDLHNHNFYELNLYQTFYIYKKDLFYNDLGEKIYKRKKNKNARL